MKQCRYIGSFETQRDQGEQTSWSLVHLRGGTYVNKSVCASYKIVSGITPYFFIWICLASGSTSPFTEQNHLPNMLPMCWSCRALELRDMLFQARTTLSKDSSQYFCHTWITARGPLHKPYGLPERPGRVDSPACVQIKNSLSFQRWRQGYNGQVIFPSSVVNGDGPESTELYKAHHLHTWQPITLGVHRLFQNILASFLLHLRILKVIFYCTEALPEKRLNHEDTARTGDRPKSFQLILTLTIHFCMKLFVPQQYLPCWARAGNIVDITLSKKTTRSIRALLII